MLVEPFKRKPAWERLTESQMKQLRGLSSLFEIRFEQVDADHHRIIPFDGPQTWLVLPTRKAHARLLAELCQIVGEKIVFSVKQNCEDTLLALQPRTLSSYAKAHREQKAQLRMEQQAAFGN